MKFIGFICLSAMGFSLHYLSWVKDWWPFQIIDSIYLFLMAIGSCNNDFYNDKAPHITPLYWFSNLSILAANCWCFFGEGHCGEFFGALYLMVTLVVFTGVINWQIKNRNKDKDPESIN